MCATIYLVKGPGPFIASPSLDRIGKRTDAYTRTCRSIIERMTRQSTGRICPW